MAKKKAFYAKDYRKHFGATIFFLVTFICFSFCVIGEPMGVLMIHSAYPENATDPQGDNPCYTMWGAQSECLGTTYSWRIDKEDCDAILYRFEFAEAFSILAIFALFFQIFFAWLQVGGSNYKILLLVWSSVAIAFTLVPWAIVTSLYHQSFCGKDTLTSAHTSLGPGYALFVVSFALQIIGTVAFALLEPGRFSMISASNGSDKYVDEDDANGTRNHPTHEG